MVGVVPVHVSVDNGVRFFSFFVSHAPLLFCDTQHRPDLFRVIQRTAPARSVQGADTNEGVMNEKGSHRSNPLQFLYGGMFVRKHKLSEPPLNLARGDSELEELETGEEPTMATTPSWWQKLALSLHGRPLACEEDPSQYDFAFSVRGMYKRGARPSERRNSGLTDRIYPFLTLFACPAPHRIFPGTTEPPVSFTKRRRMDLSP